MADSQQVRHFRQILIWPLQLMPLDESGVLGQQWRLMAAAADSPWQLRASEFEPGAFQERHYREFITFLPYVQRFLYGEGETEANDVASYGKSPLHVFRRHDVKSARLTFRDGAEIDLAIAHIDLYFFFDIDVVILAFEVMGDDLPLPRVQDILFRFGRSFPAQWDEDGGPASCLARVAWRDAGGRVLATSDYDDRDAYLDHLASYRSPRLARHWAWLLEPMVPHHSDVAGGVRYRQLEYHRMPLMAYLALDEPFSLSEADFYRIGMVTRPDDDEALPGRLVRDFIEQNCYDRYWSPEQGVPSASTRMMCNGQALVVVGDRRHRFFCDAQTGVLGQFRHQQFLLALIAHFHKAALLTFSDRMAVALARLNVADVHSVRLFKRDIRIQLEVFLRFTQRYWFSEISNQAVTARLFEMLRRHLGTAELYREVQDSVRSMSQYLESDDLRRQADTIVKLTVVTILSLVGTTVTGFLGMNVFDLADASPLAKVGYFAIVLAPTLMLTLYTLMKARPLAEFLERMADQRAGWRGRLAAFIHIWRRRRG
ncbi:CorA family divalent cation transporter [Jeongeupia sp. USM3]|uniref:CorA family divalent cation transporter n=1 Tax=Jeongeupia sp. USM3 TaxID=1906741 RepID=UPI00089DE3E8|nr:CorA family divalent cation transporter [Jeongeupia sp. USM3]AOX99110.1 hypothetical protein BJP62_00770 [Jeongeupia sp. USM3]